MGFGFGLWIWIFLKVHSLWLGIMYSILLFSCCQFDAAKYYAGQVKCVTPWEFAKLIPVGCAKLSPFKSMTALFLGMPYM